MSHGTIGLVRRPPRSLSDEEVEKNGSKAQTLVRYRQERLDKAAGKSRIADLDLNAMSEEPRSRRRADTNEDSIVRPRPVKKAKTEQPSEPSIASRAVKKNKTTKPSRPVVPKPNLRGCSYKGTARPTPARVEGKSKTDVAVDKLFTQPNIPKREAEGNTTFYGISSDTSTVKKTVRKIPQKQAPEKCGNAGVPVAKPQVKREKHSKLARLNPLGALSSSGKPAPLPKKSKVSKDYKGKAGEKSRMGPT